MTRPRATSAPVSGPIAMQRWLVTMVVTIEAFDREVAAWEARRLVVAMAKSYANRHGSRQGLPFFVASVKKERKRR